MPRTAPPVTGSIRSRRQLEFNDGRHCARIALSLLECDQPVTAGPNRCPIWPAAMTGSISHSDRFAWSVAARTCDYRAIGIDTEPIADEATIRQLRNEIATDREWARLKNHGWSPEQAFTVVFSAKESLYKCLYTLQPVFFEFRDVEVAAADATSLRLQIKPGCPNQAIGPAEIGVHYSIHGEDIFTACWMDAVTTGPYQV